jgi:glycosyltransferase involved in cell wall biosynthesis
MVSIVIPCFRQGHWLRTAVESCLAQTYSPLEVIVVDDGSDDDTASVANSFGDRIRYIHQKNAGQSVARNTGWKASRGEHLLFLDADDAIHPEAIAKLMEAAIGDSPRIAMMGWKQFWNDIHEPATDIFPPTIEPVAALLRNNPGPPHIFLSPRKTLEAIGGWDPNLSGTSDWDCWFRQLFAGADLVGVPFIGAYYRQSPGQLSRNELVMTENLALASEKLHRLAESHPKRLRSWNLDPVATVKEFRLRTAKEYAHLAWLYRWRSQRMRAARHYLHSIRLGYIRRPLKGLLSLPFYRRRS